MEEKDLKNTEISELDDISETTKNIDISEKIEKSENIENSKNIDVLETIENLETVETIESAENNEASEETEEDNKRYKAITELAKNQWSYGSPVIFNEGVLQRDQVSNRNRLILKFTNLYPETIRTLNITVIASDDEENVEVIDHQYMALGQKYLATKGGAARIDIKNEEARNFDIKVVSVEFENGSVWMNDNAVYEGIGDIEDMEVFAEAKIKDYEDTYVSGLEEVEKDDSASIANGIEILKRILWYKNTKEVVRDSKRKYQIAKQNEERKQQSEDRRLKRQQAVKRKYIKTGIALAVIIAIVVASIFLWFMPNKKYEAAVKHINGKKYEQSAKEFEQLKGFRKSKEYLAQAQYNLGLQELNNGDETKASEYFTKGHDADKNSKFGAMCGAFLDYYKGVDAMEKADYETAMKYLESSANAAADFNLINKAGAGMAQINYQQKQYEKAWKTIKNVFAKDETYSQQYGEYGYTYAKTLVDAGKVKEGMDIYNNVAKYAKGTNLNESVYNQSVKLAEDGKIDEAMSLLANIKDSYKQAGTLYSQMTSFNEKTKYWVGTWKDRVTVAGVKKTYKIYISRVLYKGEMCLRIIDKNNDYLGFDTVISRKNRVTQITIGEYQLKFKLKKFYDQKFTYTLKGGKKMVRQLKYNGETYKTTYKKK